MFNLKDKLRESLAKKNINKLSMSSFCLTMIESFFDKKYPITGYMRNNILFIKPQDWFIKTQIFLKKMMIIEKINKNLENFWYNQKITDIIIKN